MLRIREYAIVENKKDFEENYNPICNRLDDVHLSKSIKIESLQYPLGLKIVDVYFGLEWQIIEVETARVKMQEKIQERIKALQELQEKIRGWQNF